MRLTSAEIVGGVLFLLGTLPPGLAQPVAGQGITVEEYEPRNTLVVPEHIITSAHFPFVDIHGHQNGTRTSSESVDRLVGEMDELNMAVMVNLSGGSGASLVTGLENMTRDHPGRFVFFANVNFRGVGEPGWGERAAAQLEADVAAGAAGLKIFKSLGLSARDTDGDRISCGRSPSRPGLGKGRRTGDHRVDPLGRPCRILAALRPLQ